ncbi:MAG: AAA-like domain-containing protein [Cyanobacteria bacterium J06634_6]
MTELEALEAVKKAISPESLSYVQEVVFKQSWEGQLYPEIAKSVGYHPEYIRDVGAQLWRSLSESIGQKVTKKNVRFVLNQMSEEILQNSGDSRTDSDASTPSTNVHSQVGNLLSTEATKTQIAFPSVGLSVQSSFYMPRPPAEEQAFSELDRPGGLLRIKSPSNTGKTSLLLRALSYAREQGARTILINIQEADTAIMGDLGRFLRWFCRNAAQQLGVENKLDDYWDDEIGNKVSCKIYFREYLLGSVKEPVVLALDEIDQLFEHPELVQEFLPMLRAWHEEAMELKVWQKLRMALAYSTEVYVPLKISQSPFNIGLSVQLPVLTFDQVKGLVERYNLPFEKGVETDLLRGLYDLVGGHPYLIQLALYWLSERDGTLGAILEDAHTRAGIYSNHLRRHWEIMQRQPGLREAFAEALKEPEHGAVVDTMMAHQLERMGLVRLSGNSAVVSSELYYKYFKSLLLP